MEFRGALSGGKPVIFVLELDASHGGVPLSAHLDEVGVLLAELVAELIRGAAPRRGWRPAAC